MPIAAHDELEQHDRVYLEKLRLAADVILELGEDSVINNALETELHLFRDRVERALLLPGAAGGVLPRYGAAAPGPVPPPAPGGDSPPPEA